MERLCCAACQGLGGLDSTSQPQLVVLLVLLPLAAAADGVLPLACLVGLACWPANRRSLA